MAYNLHKPFGLGCPYCREQTTVNVKLDVEELNPVLRTCKKCGEIFITRSWWTPHIEVQRLEGPYTGILWEVGEDPKGE